MAFGVGKGGGGAGDCEDVGAGGADWEEKEVLVGGVDGQEGRGVLQRSIVVVYGFD